MIDINNCSIRNCEYVKNINHEKCSAFFCFYETVWVRFVTALSIFLNWFVVILFISNENLMLMVKTRWLIGGNGLIRLQKNLQNDLKCSENPMAQHISWQLIYRFNWRVVKSTPDAWAFSEFVFLVMRCVSFTAIGHIKNTNPSDLCTWSIYFRWFTSKIESLSGENTGDWIILPCYRFYWSDVTQKMFALYGEKNYGENQFWSCVFTSDRNSDRRVCRYFFACLIYLQ